MRVNVKLTIGANDMILLTAVLLIVFAALVSVVESFLIVYLWNNLTIHMVPGLPTLSVVGVFGFLLIYGLFVKRNQTVKTMEDAFQYAFEKLIAYGLVYLVGATAVWYIT